MNAIQEYKESYNLDKLTENYICQNHFGDFLIYESNEQRLWHNHIENQRQGEPKYQLEILINGGWITVEKSN